MKNRLISSMVVTFFFILILFACDDTNNINDIDSRIIPSKNVSYSEHIQPAFDYHCNNSYCHNGIDRAGGLSLADWSGTTASYLVIAPGYPDNSSLIWAIKGISSNPMPPAGVTRPLNQNQIDGITTWIKEGAKNN